jgi:hypothetical protein
MDPSRSPESLSESLSELADLAAGLGILLLPLFPLALPVVGLVLVPLALVGLLAAILALPLMAPFLLVRAIFGKRSGSLTQILEPTSVAEPRRG